MVNVVIAVVLIPVALILLAALGGVAIGLVFQTSATAQTFNASLNETADWTTETALLWNIMPVIALIVVFLVLLAFAGLKITGKI